MTTDRGTIWLCSQRTLGSLPARVNDEVASGAINAEVLISARPTTRFLLRFFLACSASIGTGCPSQFSRREEK
jgi:hypothetical protein